MAGQMLPTDDAAELLQSGGVLIMGTDTLPGFHCRADLPEAVARVLALKGRQPEKSLLVLAGSRDQVSLVTGNLDARQAECCGRCWPGPFSLILPAGGKLSPNVNDAGDTVAVRVPALDSLRSLILAAGFPLVSTSVNVSGEPPLGDLATARAVFGGRIDGLWAPAEQPGAAAGDGPVRPSALIDLTRWPPVQLRPGPLPFPAGPGGLDGDSGGI